MSRRVIPESPAPQENNGFDLAPNSSSVSPPPATSVSTPDDYLGRLIKYIPAEIVAMYLAAKGVVPPDQLTSLWWISAVAWALVPVYFFLVTSRGTNNPQWLQVALATIAFPIWVFAIGGQPVVSWPWYANHQFWSSIILIVATVLFGWIKPQPGS